MITLDAHMRNILQRCPLVSIFPMFWAFIEISKYFEYFAGVVFIVIVQEDLVKRPLRCIIKVKFIPVQKSASAVCRMIRPRAYPLPGYDIVIVGELETLDSIKPFVSLLKRLLRARPIVGNILDLIDGLRQDEGRSSVRRVTAVVSLIASVRLILVPPLHAC